MNYTQRAMNILQFNFFEVKCIQQLDGGQCDENDERENIMCVLQVAILKLLAYYCKHQFMKHKVTDL